MLRRQRLTRTNSCRISYTFLSIRSVRDWTYIFSVQPYHCGMKKKQLSCISLALLHSHPPATIAVFEVLLQPPSSKFAEKGVFHIPDVFCLRRRWARSAVFIH